MLVLVLVLVVVVVVVVAVGFRGHVVLAAAAVVVVVAVVVGGDDGGCYTEAACGSNSGRHGSNSANVVESRSCPLKRVWAGLSMGRFRW